MNKLSTHQPLGEILELANLVSTAQIQIVLQDQKENQHLRIGELLAKRGWLKQKTANFFAEEWSNILNSSTDKPLGYFLRQAALLDERQIKTILYEQKRQQVGLLFGELAVIKGWIDRQTMNFFINNLPKDFSAHSIGAKNQIVDRESKSIFSTNNLYEIVKKYVIGETDFQQIRLIKANLNHVTLKNINLSGSDLRGSSLQQVNFNGSILQKVNLNQANLENASLKATNLQSACLQKTNLRMAYLEGADLRHSDLREADLTGAYLIKAHLEGADLRGAKLNNCFLNGAFFDSSTRFDRNFQVTRAGMRFTGDSSQLLLTTNR